MEKTRTTKYVVDQNNASGHASNQIERISFSEKACINVNVDDVIQHIVLR